MALALNIFKTVTKVVTLTPSIVYTAPVGYTGVVLLSQVTNTGPVTYDVTLLHRRGNIDSEIAYQLPVESHDTLNLIRGKLCLESGDKLVLYGNNDVHLKFIVSILATLN